MATFLIYVQMLAYHSQFLSTDTIFLCACSKIVAALVSDSRFCLKFIFLAIVSLQLLNTCVTEVDATTANQVAMVHKV